jgi:hypothetical protein
VLRHAQAVQLPLIQLLLLLLLHRGRGGRFLLLDGGQRVLPLLGGSSRTGAARTTSVSGRLDCDCGLPLSPLFSCQRLALVALARRIMAARCVVVEDPRRHMRPPALAPRPQRPQGRPRHPVVVVVRGQVALCQHVQQVQHVRLCVLELLQRAAVRGQRSQLATLHRHHRAGQVPHVHPSLLALLHQHHAAHGAHVLAQTHHQSLPHGLLHLLQVGEGRRLLRVGVVILVRAVVIGHRASACGPVVAIVCGRSIVIRITFTPIATLLLLVIVVVVRQPELVRCLSLDAGDQLELALHHVLVLVLVLAIALCLC